MSDTTMTPSMAVHRAEQEWNQAQLSNPVSHPAYRLWLYPQPAVVLGCSQRNLVNAEQCMQRAGIDLVQRQAGGGAVLAGPWMLSASIALPSSHSLVTASTVQSYQWLGDLFVSVLHGLGIDTEAITPDAARQSQALDQASPLRWACFAGLSPWEVVVDRKKIVGLAQVRRRNGNLLVAGLLLDRPDWSLLCRAMAQPLEQAEKLQQCTISCSELLGRPLVAQDLIPPLEQALRAAISC